MPALRKGLSGKQVRTILRKNGFYESPKRGKGSHTLMTNGLRQAIVPDHKEVRVGTLIEIIRQSGVPRSEFET